MTLLDRRRIVALAILTLVAAAQLPAVQAHGGARNVERTFGPWEVRFLAYVTVYTGEDQWFAWEARHVETNATYDENATARFTFLDETNRTVDSRETTAVATPYRGTTVLSAQAKIPRDRSIRWMEARIELPNATPMFPQEVTPAPTPGPDSGGGPETQDAGQPIPLPGAAALVALAAAVWLKRR